MPSTQSVPIDLFFLILRMSFIALLLFIIWQVVSRAMGDLRQAAPGGTGRAQARYGRLVVVQPGDTELPTGTIFTLQAINTLGRDESNTIILNDARISSKHSLITWRGGRPWVEDLSSTNGTFFGNPPSEQPIDRPIALASGDIVWLGGPDAVSFKWVQV